MRVLRFASCSVLCSVALVMTTPVSPAAAMRPPARLGAAGAGQGGLSLKGVLLGVVSTSPRNAWAVGSLGVTSPSALIVRWDGASWTRASVSVRATASVLDAVAATSARNAWAVGSTGSARHHILIMRWNGRTWRQVPRLGGIGGSLAGVTAISARDAWAVGATSRYPTGRTLMLHWNGTAWKKVSSPAPGHRQRVHWSDIDLRPERVGRRQLRQQG